MQWCCRNAVLLLKQCRCRNYVLLLEESWSLVLIPSSSASFCCRSSFIAATWSGPESAAFSFIWLIWLSFSTRAASNSFWLWVRYAVAVSESMSLFFSSVLSILRTDVLASSSSTFLLISFLISFSFWPK